MINNKGFSLLELLLSITIMIIVMGAVVTFFLSMNASNSMTTAKREATQNAQRALDAITYEIRSAKSIYVPTTTASQLSLETSKYIPVGETDTYIDFFLCGTAVCLRKEGQDPVAITSDSVQVTNLTFSQISTGTTPSVSVSMTVGSVTLTSTASIRSY
ncbi:MAG: type II secretion system protein [Candidatus Staskawiczbacteria bacterium]|nr:type II secretion system protein [Candidatus Staskawiczbacteria bacterium]